MKNSMMMNTSSSSSPSSSPQEKVPSAAGTSTSCYTGSPTASSSVLVNTSKLRSSLRLVHCIQKERGSSCAYYADNAMFESAMNQARKASDIAAKKFMQRHSDLPIASSLNKIRSLIDDDFTSKRRRLQQRQERHQQEQGRHSDNPQDDVGDGDAVVVADGDDHNINISNNNDLIFHRIFVCFNTLISSIVHECILKGSVKYHNSSSSSSNIDGCNVNNNHNIKKGGVGSGGGGGKKHHRRGLSSEIDAKLISNPAALATQERRSTFRRTFPFDADATGLPNLSPMDIPEPVVVSSSECKNLEETQGSENNRDRSHQDGAVAAPELSSNLSDSNNEDKNYHSQQQVLQLLDLLQLFVQLKESAGVERAILSSLLAFRNVSSSPSSSDNNNCNKSLPSFRMLTNDLILEVENQRALCHQLECLPSGPHHSLVLELAQMSPRLKDLQQIILTDFDSLRSAEYDAKVIFDMITMYVDKLHSVELLIIEDLTCSMPVTSISSSYKEKRLSNGSAADFEDVQRDLFADTVVGLAWKQISNRESPSLNHDGNVRNTVNLVADIENMPAEELKSRILALLGGGCRGRGNGYSTSKSAGKSLSICESTAAEILKEDMNKALNKSLRTAPSKEWDISIYEIKFTKRLGQGASATTYLGKWTGQNVAVKVASITEFGLEGWRTEVNALQRLHHPNIIRLMGSIYNENPQTHCLVLEYCNAGDLATALRYPTPRNFFFHVSSSISNAMSYLHKRGILHRDLKPSNVLCDGNVASGKFVVKITDFGVATDISRMQSEEGAGGEESGKHGGDKLTGETGTYRWMSPEVIRHEPYSTMADVYSFSLMLWQFITHEEPFCNVGSVEAARLSAIEKQRPPIPKTTPASVAKLIETNWSDEPTQRWGFDQIAEAIQSLQESLSSEDQEWLEESHGHPVYGYENTADDMEPILSAFSSQQQQNQDDGDAAVADHAGIAQQRRGSFGKKLRGKSPRGKSGSKKSSLLSNFFRKPSVHVD